MSGRGANAFGDLVRAMRRARQECGEDGELRPWTRADLARRAGLSARQVTRVEDGSVVNLVRLLPCLADAFELGTTERTEFYARAGHVYSRPEAEPDLRSLERLLARLPYPAYARTPLWDFVGFNALSAHLWGYDDPAVRRLFDEAPLASNMLRTLVDPRFQHREHLPGDRAWARDVRRCVAGFRMMAFRYGDTDRYRQLAMELRRYRDLDREWSLADGDQDSATADAPLVEVDHPRLGRMTFISTRVPERYAFAGLDLGVYVPMPGSEEALRRLREEAGGPRAILFPGRAARPFDRA